MAVDVLAHRIHVASWAAGAATAWTVAVDGDREAAFMGQHARDRALEAALVAAERLRRDGPVSVVVEPNANAAPARPDRLAS